jgi:hypothetical protein
LISKVCFKCNELKNIDQFYKHKAMLDGHLNKCKDCTKKDVKIHRRDNESVRIYDRERYHLDPSRKFNNRENTIEWRLNNPLAYAAHTAVKSAIRNGSLIRLPCIVCQETEHVHAHHKDYNKPLEVEWLCARCHSKQHNPEDF